MADRRSLKFLVLNLIAILLALPLVTMIFAAAPLRVLRKVYGSKVFWLAGIVGSGLLLAIGAAPGALALFVLVTLIGLQTILEDSGFSLFLSGAISVLLTLSLLGAAIATWSYSHGTSIHQLVFVQARDALQEVSKQITEQNSNIQVNVDSVLHQMPSAVAIVLMMALAIALMSERRLRYWFGFPTESFRRRAQLAQFRAPDFCMWITIASIFFAFALQGRWPGIESIALNFLNVLVVLYFLQGIAIVSMAFLAYRVSPFWRSFWYLMIFLQLHLLVSFLGFSDFWLNLRGRLPGVGPNRNSFTSTY